MPLKTKLLPHQERVVRRMLQPDQPGLVMAWGLGSGKTLGSIAVQEALGLDADIVVPASLMANYDKELKRHLDGSKLQRVVHSMQAVARRDETLTRPLLIIDEGHKGRNGASATARALLRSSGGYFQPAKRLVLTASPFYNHPSDIAELVNVATGGLPALYADQEGWDTLYVEDELVVPSLWQRFVSSAHPGVVRRLRQGEDLEELKGILGKYVDHHGSSGADYPRVRRTQVLVPMSDRQQQAHDQLRNRQPSWVRLLLDAGLAPQAGDARELNAFLTASRQLCDSAGGEAPKLDEALARLLTCLASNPRAKAMVYSNFIGSCLEPYKERLRRAGVRFVEFTGEEKKKERTAAVEALNSGAARVLVASSAAGEGLDLVGVRLVQIMEPAWNRERLAQAEGRAVRYRSHTHLPEAEREVEVQSYISVDRGKRQGMTTDEYLAKMSRDKQDLIGQFRTLLPEEC